MVLDASAKTLNGAITPRFFILNRFSNRLMTIYFGNLQKMQTALASPVQYHLSFNEEKLDLNSLLGKSLSLHYTGSINCVHCNRITKKSFNQGYCYPCFSQLAQCDRCIMKPEECHYHEGTCREPAWGEQFCFQSHYVYLSNTSDVKVGITRGTQIPTRWIDQGAIQALPIIKVPSRYISGLVEVAFKEHVSDKTAWQRMLKGNIDHVDLVKQREYLINQCFDHLDLIIQEQGMDAIEVLDNAEPIDIAYPVLEYPNKIKSFNFDKQATVEGTLMGIKGQYLLFDTGVINIRKFGGYEVEIKQHHS